MNKRTRFWIRLQRNWYDLKSFLKNIRKDSLHAINIIVPCLLFIALGMAIYDFGFKPFRSNSPKFNFWLSVILDILIMLTGARILLELFERKRLRARIFNIVAWVFVLILAFYVLPQKSHEVSLDSNRFIFLKILLYAGIAAGFLTEVSYLLQYVYRGNVNPALLFVVSFALIILIGAVLLKLPNATTSEITAIDALFTSTSAVCVTGLTVVDTATRFTSFGQVIIMVLIQIGALGIMTFAGLLAYAVAGGASFKSHLAFRDMFNASQVGNIFRFVANVVAVTALFEILGAVSIYFSLDPSQFERKIDMVFFSVFHAISAFSNAGFSTLSNNLYEGTFRFNYPLHFFISVLIILGGIGFPIVFNLYRYSQVKTINYFNRLVKNPGRIYLPRVINLNSRLALVVTGILLLIGFLSYFIFEQKHTLAEHPTLTGKIVTSFFGSVTPRTAGFNTVDMMALSLPTILTYIFLMWVGASPGSTGGGIKTTTAGVAILNAVSIIRGKDRTEFFRSEISQNSIRRAFAVIILSLLFIGLSTFVISINDGDKGLVRIAFEAFSAFSTVGLSIGLTPLLSEMSKIVLVITMFVGRVGTVTLLVAFITQSKQLYYRYPKEEVTL